MERLTSNKEASEMSMYELAHNSCYGKEGKARVRDFKNDFDARELTIKLLEKYADIPNEFTCDEDFDDFISDSLQYGTKSILGLIALFYRNIWAMANLREYLKEYEDLDEILKNKYHSNIGMKKIVENFIEAVFKDEKYEGFLVLTNEDAKKYDEWEKMDRQNRLLKLPCAVGDTVWYISEKTEKQGRKKITVEFVEKGTVDNITLGMVMVPQITVCNSENIWTTFDSNENFGKTVFLTKEKAEAALKELTEGK